MKWNNNNRKMWKYPAHRKNSTIIRVLIYSNWNLLMRSLEESGKFLKSSNMNASAGAVRIFLIWNWEKERERERKRKRKRKERKKKKRKRKSEISVL